MTGITLRHILQTAADLSSVEGENAAYDMALAEFIGELSGNALPDGTYTVSDLIEAAVGARSAYYTSPNLEEVRRALSELLDDLLGQLTKKDLFLRIIG